MKVRAFGAFAVMALSLSACGNDEQAASEAIAAWVMEGSDEGSGVTRQGADCVGDGMVEEIGIDKLIEYRILTEDLEVSKGLDNVEMSRADAGSAAEVMMDCADVKQIYTSALGDLTEDARACVEENLGDQVIHEFLVARFMDELEEGQQAVVTALQECMAGDG
jgi:hypothetical protein